MAERMNNFPDFIATPENMSAFSEAITALSAHSDEFGIGRPAVSITFQTRDRTKIANEVAAEDLPDDEATAAAARHYTTVPLSQKEEMARSVVSLTNAPVLEAVGLGLSSLRVASSVRSGAGRQTVGVVRLQVVDGGRLCRFLLSAKPEEADDVFKQSMLAVTYDMVSEASDAIATGKSEQTALETLAYGQGIVAGLEQIGLADSIATVQLHELCDHAQQGDVREFVIAKKAGLLDEPGAPESGPSTWQRDRHHQAVLYIRWQGIVTILRNAQANPKAQSLAAQLLATAQAHLEYAKADWDRMNSDELHTPGHGEGFDDVFTTVGLELSMLDSLDGET